MPDIDLVIQKLCGAGARAIRRYAEVSGESPDDLPEYLMPALILDNIGEDFAVSLETQVSTLIERNDYIRKRRGISPPSPEDQTRLHTIAQALRRQLVDVVLYQVDGLDHPRNRLDFLALVEIKKGCVWPADRSKLLSILPLVDTCPYGIACGSVRSENLEWNKSEAERTNDRWYQAAMQPIRDERSYFFCARLFKGSATL
ncbi:MAG TPA: hypothetical protein VEK82_10245 [Stellaceae bacterium]|nr:hypothetical protein [Stellaceae bacterium]